MGVAAIRARLLAEEVSPKEFLRHLNRLREHRLDVSRPRGYRFPHLRITQGAFPVQTEVALSAYQDFLKTIRDRDLRFLFWFASLSVLEEVSYTRKDGQYLRWDSRSKRQLKSSFDKGRISGFGEAILVQLRNMLEDFESRNGTFHPSRVDIIEGSCLSELPKLRDEAFDLVVTSPPYCNRYDYTRTYALELAYWGYDEEALKRLRQELLTCTVENKSKREQLAQEYILRNQEGRYQSASEIFDAQQALHEVLDILYRMQRKGVLNNNNIPVMVENYFFEMNLVISELFRILRPGGQVVMVNDNVQYGGEEVPVDLILSDLAASAGFSIDHIWTLSKGKGNSSQQMGVYGRNEMRKCVYVCVLPQLEMEN